MIASSNPISPSSTPLEVLQSAFNTGRMPHAVLFYGPNFIELEAAALSLTALILESPNTTILQHPDLFTLRPQNKMRQINAENTRDLIHNIQKTPLQSQRKVALVYDADRMNASSSNIFLKTLEEPPADTTIILLSTAPYRILDTIRSRCFIFRFEQTRKASINSPEWAAWLQDYEDWLGAIIEKNNTPKARGALIIGLYQLIQAYEKSKALIADQTEGSTTCEGMAEDEVAALEVSRQKAVREQLWRDIESVTCKFAYRSTPVPGKSLYKAVKTLEKLSGLLEVNLQEATALEFFFLESLKIWSTA